MKKINNMMWYYAGAESTPFSSLGDSKRNVMNIKETLAHIFDRMNKLDQDAKNPFLQSDFSSNPFKDAFSQTYVWVEEEKNED